MQNNDFVPLTLPGTKEELAFATETLGEYGRDWEWHKVGNKFEVRIAKSESDRINKKYGRISRGKKERGER